VSQIPAAALPFFRPFFGVVKKTPANLPARLFGFSKKHVFFQKKSEKSRFFGVMAFFLKDLPTDAAKTVITGGVRKKGSKRSFSRRLDESREFYNG
jgi:hypothetical protein